ncbi:Phage Mu protein F like protein [Eubacterium limosum]|uniref:Phage Mu protein F like protein n=1 Tax=Eubacterium limosum TaxID=1736 RepID=A0A6N3FE95_EUBLI
MTYWEKRQQQLNKQLEKDEAKLKKRLSSFYDAEFRKLERQIAAYYTQYGEGSVIEYRKLMESLPAEDRRLLMEQMDAFAKKYPEYAHLMPIRESIYKLNRLEGLQHSILMQQYEIGAANIEQITDHLNRQALRAANAAAEALGFGKNFYAVNADIIKKFVDVPWVDGKNFSTRIWGNTEKLANYLNTDIAQAFARGDSYDSIVRNLRKRFDKVTRNDAYRLVYTEGTYVMAEAQMTPFEGEFEEYRVSTVGDGKVCDICREVAKKTFQIKDRKPGINFPPLHAWCRCSFTIEVSDWDAWMEDYEQRHGGGQSVKNIAGAKNSDIINYTDAKTIKEAEAYAKSLGVESASFKGSDITTANAMNRALADAFNYCPELADKIKFYGTTQEKNKLFKADLAKYYEKLLRTNYPGQSSALYERESQKHAARAIGKANPRRWAEAYDGKVDSADQDLINICKKYAGVSVNSKFAKDSVTFAQGIANSAKTKFHPQGCDTIKSVFDHEFGHQLDYLLDLRNDKDIQEAWAAFNKLTISDRNDTLSVYAYRDNAIAEFIAEGYAEYKNNPTPRKWAKIIGDKIERKITKK